MPNTITTDSPTVHYNLAQRVVKRGTCEVCGQRTTRTRTFTAECLGEQGARVEAIQSMRARAHEWSMLPVVHKGCERAFEEDDNEARCGGGGGD